MAVRPVDLQQILTKMPDIGRDSATQQQQPLIAQHALATEEAKRSQERAETVKQFDETGLAALHDREERREEQESGTDEEREQAENEDAVEDPASAAARAAQARLGRHVDLQA